MSPSNKESEVLTASPEFSGSSNGSRLEDTTSRPQPVALEVPVTVNGARTVEGSDKREPFSETTKTVLVFASGAVIRLGSPVSPGQLLFLTNEKTKKEVVCQVVKSKNYSSVSGYVELEFTEPVAGFWGMRFPSERPIAPAAARPVSVPSTPSGIPGTTIPSSAHGVSSVSAATEKPAERMPPSTQPPTVPTVQADATIAPPDSPLLIAPPAAGLPEAPATKRPEPPSVPVAGVSSSLATSLAGLLEEAERESPSAAGANVPSKAPQAKQANSPRSGQSEELKQHTARLQEQLSSLMFNSAAESNAERARTGSVAPSKPAPPAPKSSLEGDDVKIPAWLEPLARNAAAPASTQELIEREKAKHAAELEAKEPVAPEPLPITAVEPAPSPARDLPGIGNLLPLDDEVQSQARATRGSRKGVVLGAIAAGLLLAAGGAWYLRQPGNNAAQANSQLTASANTSSSAAPPSLAPAQPAVQPSAKSNPQSIAESSTDSAKPGSSSAAHEPVTMPSSAPNPAPAPSPSASRSATNSRSGPAGKENPRTPTSAVPAAEKEKISRPAPESSAEPQPKKPAIGEVHLASPMMNRRASNKQNDADAPTLGATAPDAGGLDSAFGSASKEPAAPEAPLPVGGNVTPAKLLSMVAPIYPALAKSQHISGDVVIDALIDPNGRVTAMKVISGPGLLHQAAKDALRQWKYQPATLDGKPVNMHLNVKLQFHAN